MMDVLASPLAPLLESVSLLGPLTHMSDILEALQSLFKILTLEESESKLQCRIFHELICIIALERNLEKLAHVLDQILDLILVYILQIALSHSLETLQDLILHLSGQILSKLLTERLLKMGESHDEGVHDLEG